MNRARCLLPLVLLATNACLAPSPEPASSATPTAEPPRTTSTSPPSPVPPTATVTLAPAPRYFTEEFDGAAPHWGFERSGGETTALGAVPGGGSLRLTLTTGNVWAYAFYEPHQYSDVRVEAVVEVGAGGQGSAGVFCRHSPESGWYEFNVHTDGTYALLFGRWLADGIAHYTPLVIAESETITEGLNRIGLTCAGDAITAFVNDRQVRSRQEKQYVLTRGTVGLSAASFDAAPVVITYQSVTVGPP